MPDLTPTEIFNEFSKKKMSKDRARKELIEHFKNSRKSAIRTKALELLIKIDLESEDIRKVLDKVLTKGTIYHGVQEKAIELITIYNIKKGKMCIERILKACEVK